MSSSSPIGPNQEGLIWFLKNAWTRISDKYPDLNFYIAGRNAPEWFIQRCVYKNVIYLGEVGDAYKFMNSKAVMIVPLLSGSGMRIKIIEGMALGKTIISTSIGAEGIKCTHEKDILIADTVNDFINEIERVIINNDIFERVGNNAVIFVKENFNNITISGSLTGFYRSHAGL